MELGTRFRPILSSPDAQLCLLDKLCTYERAREAGVPTPRFWPVEGRAGLEAVRDELVYPLIVKPHASIDFQERFGGIKHFAADDLAEARDAVARAEDAGLSVMLVERIVAPDTVLRSYYTWIDRSGEPVVHFSKRLLRRSPPGMGLATYHVTDWIPEIRDLALRLLGEVGLEGVAQVEFILDPRRRRQQAHRVQRALHPAELADRGGGGGPPLDRLPRRRRAAPEPVAGGFRAGVRLWDPQKDLRAYRELRARGGRPSRLDRLAAPGPPRHAQREGSPADAGAPRARRAPSRRPHRAPGGSSG